MYITFKLFIRVSYVCLSVCLIYLSINLSIRPIIFLSIYSSISIWPSIYLSIYLQLCIYLTASYIYLSIYLCLSTYSRLSIYLSIVIPSYPFLSLPPPLFLTVTTTSIKKVQTKLNNFLDHNLPISIMPCTKYLLISFDI